MKSIKKIIKSIVLITSSISILLNLVLIVKLFSLEKMIEANEASYRRRLPLLKLKEIDLSRQENLRIYELRELEERKF